MRIAKLLLLAAGFIAAGIACDDTGGDSDSDPGTLTEDGEECAAEGEACGESADDLACCLGECIADGENFVCEPLEE